MKTELSDTELELAATFFHRLLDSIVRGLSNRIDAAMKTITKKDMK